MKKVNEEIVEFHETTKWEELPIESQELDTMSITVDDFGYLNALSIGGELINGINVLYQDIEFPLSSYKYEDGQLIYSPNVHLQLAKEWKWEELTQLANEKINQGFLFDGVRVPFGADDRVRLSRLETALNFSDAITWVTSKDFSNSKDTTIEMTKDKLAGLTFGVTFHEIFIMSVLNQRLKPLILNAKSLDELENITWNVVSIPTFEAYSSIRKCHDKLSELKKAGLKL